MGMQGPDEGKTYPPLKVITGGGAAASSELPTAQTLDDADAVMFMVAIEHPDVPPAA